MTEEVQIAIGKPARVISAAKTSDWHDEPRLLLLDLDLHIDGGILVVNVHSLRRFSTGHIDVHVRLRE